jgi:L-fucose isomerase-like protein
MTNVKGKTNGKEGSKMGKLYPVLSKLMAGVERVRAEKIKIGIVGTMRRVFQEEFGKGRFAELLTEVSKDARASILTSEAVGVPDGIIYAGELDQIQDTVNHFLGEKIDGLIIIPINYGDEESAARLAADVYRALRIPVYTYIWPDAPIESDGRRLSDNECGILPMRQHMRVTMGKNPGYFPFCDIESQKFSAAWDSFVRVCSGVRAIRNIRLLQLGAAEPTFYAIEADPDDLRKRFGFRSESIDIWNLITAVQERLENPPDWFSSLHGELSKILDFSGVQGKFPDLSAKLTLALGWIVEQLNEKQSNCVSIRCWEELLRGLGVLICPLNGILYSMGVMAPCETDKPGVIASALLHGMGIGEEKDLNVFADLTRWDHGKPLWWHCGPFSAAGMRECSDCGARVEEGWILKVPAAGLVTGAWGNLGDLITFAQIRPNADGKLQLSALNGEICEGTPTIGTHFYTQMADPEKAWRFIMDYPFDHHCSGRVGNYLPLLREAAPWLGLDTKPAFLDNIRG